MKKQVKKKESLKEYFTFKNLLFVFGSYFATYFFPTLIALAVATGPYPYLAWLAFFITPTMATISYFYDKSRGIER